jgi:hypothetical protein
MRRWFGEGGSSCRDVPSRVLEELGVLAGGEAVVVHWLTPPKVNRTRRAVFAMRAVDLARFIFV